MTLNGHRTETYSLYLRRYRRDRAVSPRFRGGEPTQLTKNNDTYIRTFQWSPDSKKIVYTDRKNRINLLDVSNKQLTTISQSLLGEARNVSFSSG